MLKRIKKYLLSDGYILNWRLEIWEVEQMNYQW